MPMYVCICEAARSVSCPVCVWGAHPEAPAILCVPVFYIHVPLSICKIAHTCTCQIARFPDSKGQAQWARIRPCPSNTQVNLAAPCKRPAEPCETKQPTAESINNRQTPSQTRQNPGKTVQHLGKHCKTKQNQSRTIARQVKPRQHPVAK